MKLWFVEAIKKAQPIEHDAVAQPERVNATERTALESTAALRWPNES